MNRKHTGTVYLPPKLFRQPEGNQLDTKSYLPLGFQFAKKTNKFASLLEEQDDQVRQFLNRLFLYLFAFLNIFKF